jgi:molybdate transport system substrate-binding protein
MFIGLGSACAGTLSLSVCASMTDVFKELAANFYKDHPEANIRTNFGPSGSLAKQIEQGAPADLFISANGDWLDYLVEQEMIDYPSRMVLARNRLVFIGRPDLAGITPTL